MDTEELSWVIPHPVVDTGDEAPSRTIDDLEDELFRDSRHYNPLVRRRENAGRSPVRCERTSALSQPRPEVALPPAKHRLLRLQFTIR